MKKTLNYYKAWVREYTRKIEVGVPTSPFNFYVMNRDPLIVFTITPGPLANLFYMSEVLSSISVTFVIGFTWDISSPKKYIRVAREYREFVRRFGDTKTALFLCNSQSEKDALDTAQVPSIVANRSMFHDENIFSVHGLDKIYPAVINSRMGKYKRIELARYVENVAIITSEYELEYMNEVRRCVRSSNWLNYRAGTYTRLSAYQVAAEVSRAHAGLILSRQEGHCNASIEYLLCGVPVVSTKSKGGRDIFYDQDYTVVVDASAEAVKRGVDELTYRRVDPYYIRRNTLEKINSHRQTLVNYLNEVLLAAKQPPRSTEQWFSKWNNKMKFFCDPSSFELLVHSDYFERDIFFSNEIKAKEAYPDLFLT